MRCLICYDIGQDRRRDRVVKRLRRCARRVQYSVWEADLEPVEWERLWRELEGMIEPRLDGLLLVPVCAPCHQKRRQAGTTGAWAGGGEVVV